MTDQTNPAKSLPWIAPFTAYLVLSQAAAAVPHDYYPWAYAACTIITSGITLYLLSCWKIVKPHRQILPGLAAGIIGIILWISLSSLGADETMAAVLPEWLRPAPRAAFNPFEAITDPATRWLFIAVRVTGLALLVPVAEELFWRGWLMRWIISRDWAGLEIGTFTMGSFLSVTLLFTMAHPEWLAAAVWCVLINLLLYWKKDLWNCIVAHGVSNLCLAAYVMLHDAWYLW